MHEIWQNYLDFVYSGKWGFNLSIYAIVAFGIKYLFFELFNSYKWYDVYKNKNY